MSEQEAFNDLEREFSHRGLLRHGLLLLDAGDAIRFVNECCRRAIPVLGLDGFVLEGDRIRPSIEDSMDLSATTEGEAYDRASRFLGARQGRGLKFEVVCG